MSDSMFNTIGWLFVFNMFVVMPFLDLHLNRTVFNTQPQKRAAWKWQIIMIYIGFGVFFVTKFGLPVAYIGPLCLIALAVSIYLNFIKYRPKQSIV